MSGERRMFIPGQQVKITCFDEGDQVHTEHNWTVSDYEDGLLQVTRHGRETAVYNLRSPRVMRVEIVPATDPRPTPRQGDRA